MPARSSSYSDRMEEMTHVNDMAAVLHELSQCRKDLQKLQRPGAIDSSYLRRRERERLRAEQAAERLSARGVAVSLPRFAFRPPPAPPRVASGPAPSARAGGSGASGTGAEVAIHVAEVEAQVEAQLEVQVDAEVKAEGEVKAGAEAAAEAEAAPAPSPAPSSAQAPASAPHPPAKGSGVEQEMAALKKELDGMKRRNRKLELAVTAYRERRTSEHQQWDEERLKMGRLVSRLRDEVENGWNRVIAMRRVQDQMHPRRPSSSASLRQYSSDPFVEATLYRPSSRSSSRLSCGTFDDHDDDMRGYQFSAPDAHELPTGLLKPPVRSRRSSFS